jgi:hypothetical protein
MKKEIIQMQKLFEATEMTAPMDENAQAHSLKMKRKNLISLMRKLGIYSSLYGVILAFFFLFKKIGLALSVIQSAYLLLSISIVATASIGAGGVVAVKTYLIDKHGEEEPVPRINAVSEVWRIADKSTQIESTKAKVANQEKEYIYFQGFSSSKADNNLLQRATKAMSDEFTRASAGTVVITGDEPYARYTLSGSIEIIDGRYHISVKLIEIGTRRIIFASSEVSDTADGVIDHAKKMGVELSGRNLF